jgi:U3 small nucleolar RNA-associated protein 23
MRLKHARRSRKLLTYFRAAHGFKPPFSVLLDGTAIQAALNHDVALAELLPKMLGGKVRMVVPRAVVAELHALGRHFAAAAKYARRLKIVATPAAEDTGDSPTKPSKAEGAGDALLSLVARGNPGHYFVLTEDAELQQRLGDLQTVPLLRFARGRLVLEAPGKASGDADNDPAAPAKSVAPGQKRRREDDTPEGEGVATAQVPKKRRIKQPNPLSIKNKKKKRADGNPDGNGSGSKAGAGSGSGSGKRRRKKRHAAAPLSA